jgi:chorismate mutase / prephenate dehydratase
VHRDETERLKDLREALDGLDTEIVRLIGKRLELVGRVGQAKNATLASLRHPDREREVLDRAESAARELGLSAPFIRKVFADIIAYSLARQSAALVDVAAGRAELRVAFQGVPYAYSYLAVQDYLASQALTGKLRGFRSFREAADELISGAADLAFLPIENTTAGSINQVYDLLRETDLHIVGEATWKVDHCLAAPTDVPLASLRKVLSHPQALEQCSLFLHRLPHVEQVPYFDTAEAMQAVAEAGDPEQAAIGPPEAAAAYGLVVLQRSVSNQTENHTRFVALSRTPAHFDPRIPCKTSLILTTRHERGALDRCLKILADHGLSLTKLESRPRPGRPWEYMFFMDFEGNVADPQSAAALDALHAQALFLKVLGSYPARATPLAPQATAVKTAAAAPAEAARGSAAEVTEAAADGAEAAVGKAAADGAEAAVGKAAADSAEAAVGKAAGGSAAASVGETAGDSAEAAPAARGKKPAAATSKHYRLAGRSARAEDTVVRVGDLLIGGGGFIVMAGPCAVESQAQIQATALHVRERGAHILRGGVFKPRTSPYSFQGLGLEGLEMLAAAGRACGMPVVTEVMSPEQVRAVAEKADILQIGARNMQNFQLLREVGKVDRPVLLKRGLSSTIEEWLAAAEYILAQGNGQVILCERGIRTFESATRNTLDLSAVVVLRERTHLPVVVDPSHGTGRRDYVAPMAFAARACGAHGILVEVHPDPDQALSDGDQSLDFDEFGKLMEGLGRVRP